MTSQAAFQLIRQFEIFYQFKFAPADLQPVWSDLLQLPEEALKMAFGESQIVYKFPPTPRQVLGLAEKQAKKLNDEAVQGASSEGEELFTLMIGWLDGKITRDMYSTGLYELSRKYKKPEYAYQAAQLVQDQAA